MAGNKEDLVEKLVELTVRDPVGAISGTPSELDKEMHEKLRKRFKEEQINVRLKHFTLDQVNALLDFYTNEMGRSILESQERIFKEFEAGMKLISGEVREESRERRHREYKDMAKSFVGKTSDNGT